MSSTPIKTIKARQEKLSQLIKQFGFDAVAVNPSPNLVYLTDLHFHLSERPVVCIFTPDKPPVLILPELESAKINNLEFELQSFTFSEDVSKWQNAFSEAIRKIDLQTGSVGVDDRGLRMLELRLLQSSLPYSTFDDADTLFAELRMYKDELEFKYLQDAVNMAQDAMRLLLQEIKIGMTEKEIASMLVQNAFKLGSEAELPFSPIVASGPNSANPHASPSDRKIQNGDMLVIDWGVNVNGYFSDLTRTFSIGDPSPQQSEIYNIVHEANQAAHAAVKPGITAGEVDKAARDIIEQAGYGEYFTTRTGHGLGMQVHEPPYIRTGNEIILKPGMVFTIEPGIYIPDQDGVRIEDDVIVTEDGIHSFSNMSREMKIIGN